MYILAINLPAFKLLYYNQGDVVQELPITVTTEESDKSRVTSLSCVNKVINHSIEKIQQPIVTVFILSDGCASQFRSRYVFSLLTHMQPYINIEWHYNEAHHGPMDGVGGTVKNLVYRRVLSGDVVINIPKEFANFADQITSVDCLFLENTELLPEEVTKAPPIPSTLKIHRVQRMANGQTHFPTSFSS